MPLRLPPWRKEESSLDDASMHGTSFRDIGTPSPNNVSKQSSPFVAAEPPGSRDSVKLDAASRTGKGEALHHSNKAYIRTAVGCSTRAQRCEHRLSDGTPPRHLPSRWRSSPLSMRRMSCSCRQRACSLRSGFEIELPPRRCAACLSPNRSSAIRIGCRPGPILSNGKQGINAAAPSPDCSLSSPSSFLHLDHAADSPFSGGRCPVCIPCCSRSRGPDPCSVRIHQPVRRQTTAREHQVRVRLRPDHLRRELFSLSVD